ncbi:MAG: symmetrical bis(5'-nucleosyl)-tetraphosphatase [Acidobacteriota bacterium]
MATYVIGDIQGCYRTLLRLLARIAFDPARDRIWLTGDLVNRGPQSLEVLRWAKELEARLTMVLGNHDLHLLAQAKGVREARPYDTLDAILTAPDRDALLKWLRRRPLFHREGPYVLVHAGLLPTWSLEEAQIVAGEVGEALSSERSEDLLEAVYASGEPPRWDRPLTGMARLRVAASVFTRLRTCTREGRLCLEFNGPPGMAPPGCLPWFRLTSFPAVTVLFGHWAALGLHLDRGFIGLDTGCVWGGALSAFRLEDRSLFQEPYSEESRPEDPGGG